MSGSGYEGLGTRPGPLVEVAFLNVYIKVAKLLEAPSRALTSPLLTMLNNVVTFMYNSHTYVYPPLHTHTHTHTPTPGNPALQCGKC